jgi:hypothetical protein
MAMVLSQGLHINSVEPADNRTIFPTVAEALATVTPNRRYDGLSVRILDDGGNPVYYVFKLLGLPALNPANWEFVVDPAMGGAGGGGLVQVNTKDDLPAIGNIQMTYVTTDNGALFRWNGSEYIAMGGGSDWTFEPLRALATIPVFEVDPLFGPATLTVTIEWETLNAVSCSVTVAGVEVSTDLIGTELVDIDVTSEITVTALNIDGRKTEKSIIVTIN